jgi:hypothetical protein
MIPRDQTTLIVEDELKGAQAWAGRYAVPLDWIPDSLELRAVLTQPVTTEKFYLRGHFDDYRELPPEWQFCDESWSPAATPRNYPRPETPPIGSVFHTNPVVCAPFNRLAYSAHGGPHGDWGITQWHSLPQAQVKAATIGDMLAVFLLHISYTKGRMG